MTAINKKLPSLRKQYIFLTIVTGLFVIAVASYNYHNLMTTKDSVSSAYTGMLQEQANLKRIRNTLLMINKDINVFLLDSSNENLTKKIASNTTHAIKSLTALSESLHPYHIELNDIPNRSISHFKQLKTQVTLLIESRREINKQYPGLSISANIMQKQQDSIKSGFEILTNEIESGDLASASPELYPLLLKSYAIWINAISQTRIYMANRLASFSSEILDEQARGLKDILLLFVKKIEKLQSLYTNTDSFEATEILQSTLLTSQSWYENFSDLRAIAESDKWRSDTLIMKIRIFPLIETITQDMNEMEQLLKVKKLETEEALKQRDKEFNHLIFAIIALFLFFISAILISMHWMIFSPIEKVTLALRSKAFNKDLPDFDSPQTLEIGRLIDSFMEMDKKVTLRQNALEYQTMHDHLTGLPNRFLLNQKTESLLLDSEKRQASFVLFLMDLDFFKDINDTLGHDAGDFLLIEVSKRIQSLIDKPCTLARLGGDEFAIVLPDTEKETSSKLADTILEQMRHPFEINDQKFNIGISIGIVSYPDDGQDIESLLQYADMAMYTAKRKRTGYSFYESIQNIYSKTRLDLIHDVAEALGQNQFETYFQPKLNAASGEICGAEALLRWNHQEYGFISPEKIVEAAERAGSIHKLTLFMLENAITQCSQWHRAGFNLTVSVNLSMHDLSNQDFSDEVKALMDQHELEYPYLTLEITENVMMENLTITLEVLNKLHALGVHISIDDFGTGFSSLAYLKKLPVDELKIDKSFIMEMNEELNDREIVSSTINLGHNLGLNVVAEGIETEKVLNVLKEMGCDQMQGYFIGKPMCPEEFEEFLKSARVQH